MLPEARGLQKGTVLPGQAESLPRQVGTGTLGHPALSTPSPQPGAPAFTWNILPSFCLLSLCSPPGQSAPERVHGFSSPVNLAPPSPRTAQGGRDGAQGGLPLPGPAPTTAWPAPEDTLNPLRSRQPSLVWSTALRRPRPAGISLARLRTARLIPPSLPPPLLQGAGGKGNVLSHRPLTTCCWSRTRPPYK